MFAAIAVFFANAQRISAPDYRFLQKKEDSMMVQARNISAGREVTDRFLADSIFTRMFVRALKTKNSFYYPFDSLLNVSKLYSPDSTFRIYTWQMVINENRIRQHGAIQMRTPDGSFKRFVLIDKSDVTKNVADTIGNNEGWMGALYYKILQNTYNGRTYYTLLGFDEHSIRSNRKVIDILEFVNGEPVFGNPVFYFENSNVYNRSMARFILEYKKEAAARLTYDQELGAIVYDELVSESGDPKKKWTMVPDGEYEGFKWINGKWVHVTNVFGNTPPQKYSATETIRDAKGNIDETKLKVREETPSPPEKK